ncbi:MAG: hypothetical protein JSW51_03690 [Gemmatimonadota bacterium]|nr:MAG: hypothetical protein JSW51_03690 [Gemmatimonadota bacterium]
MANRDASGSPTGWDSQMWGQVPPIQRDRIKRGNYLDCYCPHCKARLNDGDMAVFEVETAQGEVGIVRVAAYLNSYHRETELSLQEGSELRDARCSSCHASLILPDPKCPECGGKVGGFKVSAGGTKVDITVCVRSGCRWYGLDADSEERLLLEGSDEW